MSAEPDSQRARQVLATTCVAMFVAQCTRRAGSRNLFRRARDRADARGVPIYSHIRGLFLLARALKAQQYDHGPDGHAGQPVPRTSASSPS